MTQATTPPDSPLGVEFPKGKSANTALAGDAPDTHANFGSTVKTALFWRSGSQIVSQIITWSATFAVIRLLDPSDYGIFALTQTLILLLSFLNGYGFASSLIQRESVTPLAIRQAFGMLILLNGSLAIIQTIAAPFVASYYGQPLVADMLRIQALIFLAMPFMIVPEVLISRSMDFRKLAIVNLTTAVITASVSIGCALSDYGVWTLVIAPIVGFWTRAILLLCFTRLFVWPSFDFRGAGAMAQFGVAMLASHCFWVIQTQSDIFIAGRFFEPHHVGLYSEALLLTQLVMTRFIPPLNEVAFPAYARLQSDAAALRWSFLKSIRLIMLVACPIYLGMSVTALPLVTTLFGAKWAESAQFITLIAIAMPFVTLQTLFAPATSGLGKPGISVRTAASGAALFLTAFYIGAQYGPIGLAWAWIIAGPILLGITISLSRPVLGVGFRDVTRAMLPGLGCALVMAIAVKGIASILPSMPQVPAFPGLIELGVLASCGAAIYAGLLWWLERDIVQELLRLVWKRKPPAEPAPAE
jgi:O-antigen/teichoic acid export membrane protein